MIRRKLIVALALLAFVSPPMRGAASASQVPANCIDWTGRNESQRPRDGRERVHVIYMVAGNCADIPWGGVMANGRAHVPFRRFGGFVGVRTEWEPTDRTAWYIGSRSGDLRIVHIQIDSPALHVDGEIRTLDSTAMLVNDRTLIPIRALGEAFGAEVWWDQDLNSAVVDLRGGTYSPVDISDPVSGEIIEPQQTLYFYGDMPDDAPRGSPSPPGQGNDPPPYPPRWPAPTAGEGTIWSGAPVSVHGIPLSWAKKYEIVDHTVEDVEKIPLGAFKSGRHVNVVAQRCNANVPELRVTMKHGSKTKVSIASDTTIKAKVIEETIKVGLDHEIERSEEQSVVIPPGKKMMLKTVDRHHFHVFKIRMTWTALTFTPWPKIRTESRVSTIRVWVPYDRIYTWEMDKYDSTCDP